MEIKFADLSSSKIYHCMTQTIIPRPIAWVLSENENLSLNLAPFSYFTAVSSKPPLIMMSIGKKPDGSFKDTRVNIEMRREFVVHIAREGQAVEVTETSRGLAAGESELGLIDAELAQLEDFRLPRLAACPVALACELHSIQEMGDVPQSLVFGRVKSLYLDDAVCSSDAKGGLVVDAKKVSPLGRLGAEEYANFGDVIHIPRPIS